MSGNVSECALHECHEPQTAPWYPACSRKHQRLGQLIRGRDTSANPSEPQPPCPFSWLAPTGAAQ